MLFSRKILNLIILVFFTLGLFFSSARIITHNNFPVVEEKHDNFYSYYLLIKEKIKKQKKILRSDEICEKIKIRELDRHSFRIIFEEIRVIYMEKTSTILGGKEKLSLSFTSMIFLLITFTFFFSIKSINNNFFLFIQNNIKHYLLLLFIFFFVISFYSFRAVSELGYSFFEMFFVSLSIYFAIYKNKILFLLTVILATLNRESGILISSIWFIFNTLQFNNNNLRIIKSEISYSFISILIPLIILISLNSKFFSCSLEFSDMTYATTSIFGVSLIKDINIIFTNYILIMAIFYFFYKDINFQFNLLFLAFIYSLIFVFFTPADHYILRIIFAPIILLYCNKYFENDYKKINS